MNLENQNDIWQIEVGGQIYEASLGELPDWIGEGSLQPEDKVRKGNLRWIEARKVPALVPFFNARANGEPMPIVQTVSAPQSADRPELSPAPLIPSIHSTQNVSPDFPSTDAHASASVRAAGEDGCVHHPLDPIAWVCSSCEAKLCRACPRSYGGNVRICPDCGSMCRSMKETVEISKKASIASLSTGEGFGFGDFTNALAYPFRFRSSLIFGGLMFAFFTVGQSAASIGGIFLIGAAIISAMLANMLKFGILANTVSNFTQGFLDKDFMPSFEDFSLWEDVVHPFFLFIGVYISSFGPFLVVAAVGIYMMFSALTEQANKYDQEISRIPGTELYAPNRTAEQSQEVKDLLQKVKQHNDRLIAQKQSQLDREVAAADSGSTQIQPPPTTGRDLETEQLMDLEKSLQQSRSSQLESLAGQNSDPEAMYQQMFSSVLRLAAPLMVFGFLALLWGLIYFPAACAVAGYSRSFLATINPLVGLDTIRRLGGTYVKILLMGLVIGIAAVFVQGTLDLVLSPFNLPRIGNIPAIVVGSFVAFYLWAVFFCLIGFALFKSADRLKLYK